MKKVLFISVFLMGLFTHAQKDPQNFRSKKLNITKDSVLIDSVSINPSYFKVFTSNKTPINESDYSIDFAKSILVIDHLKHPSVEVEYHAYPDFLTKTYFKYDPNIIIENPTKDSPLYTFNSIKEKQFFQPFDGLNTSGSISRGFTAGNNQDAVLNSSLDLQIAGKLSEKVTLRASITDSSIPIQENGYTQQLNEFDRVFIELFTDQWSLKAGDVNLGNSTSYFAKFNKKISGISLDANLNHSNSKTQVFASGALVKGKFAFYKFNGEESNQGPYRIYGPNNEQYIIIVSGSERVFVNGVPLVRGENNDYIIDYNTAEITFTPTYPINANMRITVEFQFSDRNYTRFVTYNGVQHKGEKFSMGGFIYSENDAKNQPIQQDLSDEQKQLLAAAGNDPLKMVAPSAAITPYDENKILYRKVLVGGQETFVYTTDSNGILYGVRFTNFGANQGNYTLKETIATGKIFEYIGTNLGNYRPEVQLVAPNKLQMAVINAEFHPSEKTDVQGEIAFSNNDLNLFSDVDNEMNDGLAAKIQWDQKLISNSWDVNSNFKFESISEGFKSIENFRAIEFNRDWNLINPSGNQQLINVGLDMNKQENGIVSYNFEMLKFSNSFDGNRHSLHANLLFDDLFLGVNTSLMNSESELENNYFLRLNLKTKYNFNKSWIGAKVNAETNEITDIPSQNLSFLSQQFKEYEGFFGVGDSTKVFAEIGYNFRTNDSVNVTSLDKVSSANTYFINSKLIQNKNTRLSLYANYRTVENVQFENTEAINSRLLYNQKLFNNILNYNLVYETVSGNLAQQEFTYIEVEPGQGYYTWIDYNGNGIKELNEFEIAQFQDEATYLRIALPTLNYLQTHQTKLSQSLNINLQQWSNQSGFKKFASHFQNQSFTLIDNKQERDGSAFNFNPFDIDTANLLALNFNLKNSLFFNRGQQNYSTTYNYLKSQNKTSFAIDNLENNLKMHQLQFTHKLGSFWLMDLKSSIATNENNSENYSSRNYFLESATIQPKISYLYNSNNVLDFYYTLKDKENTIGNMETLESHNLGASYRFSNQKKTSINAEFNFFLNDFIGNSNSPVGYQMLEGLQNGKNFTWSILWLQKLNSFLDLNLNYLGRKSETSQTIHTGTIQLRAHF